MAYDLRSPGLLELYSLVRHDMGFYRAFGMAGRFYPPSSSSVTTDTIYKALHSMISKHPPLGISVVGESTPSPRFVRLSHVDLDKVVLFVPLEKASDREAVLNDYVAKNLSSPFDELGKRPLWRLIVLLPPSTLSQTEHGVDIAIFFHHGIADGTSAGAFHRSLLASLNSASPSDPSGSIVTIPSLPFSPALESLLPMPISLKTLVKALFNDWFPRSAKRLWTGAPVTKPSTLQTQHAATVFPPETVAALLAACRKHQTTLTTLVEAIIARALFDALPKDGTADQLVCGVPIDLRRFIRNRKSSDPALDIGVFVASEQHRFTRAESQGDIWAVARRVKIALDAKLAAGNRNLDTGLLRYVSDLRKYFLSKIGKQRELSFEVSNAGAVDGGVGDPAGWKVARLTFVQSASVTGAAIEFTVCSVRGGDLCVAANWQKGVVEKTLVSGVMESISALVNEVIV
ncbi:hypothetical protein BV25DRAFT_1919729 [Artomyces pyxidatus]|uniref:Uncharacterized protein n=1 Tax=Artomyces pyxidatus TaxID=48021 RepID=A0ACB8SN95_9AGAM|nr:hypothetical protein BV25DRAFT_1919729 [Artomyces pyxidatus]